MAFFYERGTLVDNTFITPNTAAMCAPKCCVRRRQREALIRNSPLLGPYSRIVPRAYGGPRGGVLLLMSEVLLYW